MTAEAADSRVTVGDDHGAFDEIIHAPLRLRVCGLLRPVDRLDFSVLRGTLEVTDVMLSKHLKVLVAAGFVSMSKAASATRSDARRITWLSLTPTGRDAFDGHVRALRAIADPAAGWDRGTG